MTFLDSALRPWKVAPFKTVSHEGQPVTAEWLWRWDEIATVWIPLRPWTEADSYHYCKSKVTVLDEWQASLYENLSDRMQP